MHPMLTTAVKAARKAGSIINRASDNLDIVRVERKGSNDFVSDVDRAAEAAIVDIIREAYPHHAILAEEGGAIGESDYEWIIDPLDGTTNYLHGLPVFAVSIALAHRGVVTQAVVYDSTRNELFTATRGGGAYLNERRIRVSRRTQMNEALVATGFPYHQYQLPDGYFSLLREAQEKTAGIRRMGAAALDLAYVAAGRLDAYWELGLKPWDVAAGSLLVQEAGGLVTDFSGDDRFLEGGQVLAATPKLLPNLHQLVQAHGPWA